MLNDTFYRSFVGWSSLWVLMLALPPGSTQINSQYRLNFTHGLLSCLIATLVLWGYVTDAEIATSCTISYFIVDFVNILLNDHVFKAKSYQSPKQRKVEYFHHIFCCGVGIVSEMYHTQKCTFAINPFVNLMYAEFSTIPLMMWRYYNNIYLGYIFVFCFFICRIVYHAFVFIPQGFNQCDHTIMYAMAVPYNLMNFYFLYFIVNKFFTTSNKSGLKSGLKDGSENKNSIQKQN